MWCQSSWVTAVFSIPDYYILSSMFDLKHVQFQGELHPKPKLSFVHYLELINTILKNKHVSEI